MIKKATIANIILTMALCYIVSPWLFEKKLFFNELLSAIGLLLLMYKGLRIGRDWISIWVTLLIFWGLVHAITSLGRMDSLYYYFRNLVITYSMLAFFTGFFCMKYLSGYISKIRNFLRVYIGFFIFTPFMRFLFERFGMATLFPALFSQTNRRYVPWLLIILNIIYGFTYSSLTALVLSAFYFLLFISPGYKFFSQIILGIVLTFTALFIYLQPNLALISHHYSHYTYNGIFEVMHSNPILSIDGNSTWRMVLWKEVIVDNFPANIFGLGFGTPVLKYFPVEDYSKLPMLPYILGSHNSFVYLFGRLGIVYVLLIIPIYIQVFKEYFYHKTYYYANNEIAVFWSFFAITMIALFNPALESPIYAAAYWFILGLTAKCICNRQYSSKKTFALA